MATADDIRKYAGTMGFNPNAAGKYEVNDDATAANIFGHATMKGYSAADLDSAFGWDAGTTAGWLQKKGMPALGGAPPTAAPAPAPAVAAPTAAAPTAASPAAGANVGSIMERAARSAGTTVGASAPTPAPAPPPYQGVPSRYGQAAQTQWDESQGAASRAAAITRSGSPLMEAARLRGNQEAAARGMLGSTMGIEAAQKAMIEAATPLATADASLYSATARDNTGQMNVWNARDLDRQLSDAQFGAKLASDESQFGRTLAENARQANLGATTQLTVAGMNYDIQDRRLSADEAQFLKTFELESRKLDTQIAQFAQEFGLSVDQLELEKDKLGQQDRQYYDGLKLERDKLDQQANQFNTEWENRFSLERLASQNRIDLANIDAENRRGLMELEASYKKDIAANETISNAWGTMMQEIGRIQNNPELEEAAKVTLINNAIGSFGGFTNFWKKATGGTIDVTDLLNFSVTSTGGGTGGGSGGGGGGGGGGGQTEDTSVIPGGGGGP